MSVPGRSGQPGLSIVMPVRDTTRTLDEVLCSLERQTADPGEFEVIIVDDASAKPLAPIVDKHQQINASCLRLTPNRGRAAARNAGAAQAAAPRLLFLDGDSWALPTLVQRHLDFAARDEDRTTLLGRRLELGWDRLRRVMADGPIDRYIDEQADDPAAATFPNYEDDLRYGAALHMDAIDFRSHRAPWLCSHTHNMSVDRNLFRDLGGFDEEFVEWGYEDIELGYRLFLAHGRRGGFAYDHEALCVHLPNFRNPFRNRLTGGRNQDRIKQKHLFFDIELLGSEVDGNVERKIAHYESVLDRTREQTEGRGRGLGLPAADIAARIPALGGDDSGDGRRVLWIGAGLGLPDDPMLIRYDHALPPSPANLHMLGIDTPHDDASFAAVVNIDLWRHFTVRDLSLAIIEGLRLAPNLYLVLTKTWDVGGDSLLRSGAWDPDWVANAFGSSFPVSIIHDDPCVTVIHFRAAE